MWAGKRTDCRPELFRLQAVTHSSSSLNTSRVFWWSYYDAECWLIWHLAVPERADSPRVRVLQLPNYSTTMLW